LVVRVINTPVIQMIGFGGYSH